jgi:hypothetical protein
LHTYNLSIDIPKLRIQADYSIDGKLLLLPVKGNGNMEANVSKYFTSQQRKIVLRQDFLD